MTFEAKKQSSEKFPFKSPEEVALLAIRLGLGVPEFIKLYQDNLNEAKQKAWRTAIRFKARVVDSAKTPVSILDSTGKPLERVTVKYQHGPQYEKTQTMALIGLLGGDYGTEALYERVTQLMEQEIFLYRAYDKNTYSVIIEVEELSEKPQIIRLEMRDD